MNFKFIIIMTGMLAIASSQLKAQLEEERVRILPSTVNRDLIKVLYALPTDEPLTVKFMTRSGIADTDKISGGPYPKGISKRYNVRHISDNDFWIEISSSKMILVYRVTVSKDKKTLIPQLEKSVYNHTAVASK
jgi:hypothetical protein